MSNKQKRGKEKGNTACFKEKKEKITAENLAHESANISMCPSKVFLQFNRIGFHIPGISVYAQHSSSKPLSLLYPPLSSKELIERLLLNTRERPLSVFVNEIEIVDRL